MTPERFNKINTCLKYRQRNLSVGMIKVQKSHNLSAVIRTCDSVGIDELHVVWSDKKERISKNCASGSSNWIKINSYQNTKQAFDYFNAKKMQIIATCLSDKAVDFRDVDYTQNTIILLGEEKFGLEESVLDQCHKHIKIPMYGMVQSLNVSVANAVILYEAERQRSKADLYKPMQNYTQDEKNKILFEHGHQVYAKICKQKNIPYPDLDEYGQINAPKSWYDALKYNK